MRHACTRSVGLARNLMVRLSGDRRAVTALEYGIIASALAFVLIAAFTSLGSPLSTIFANVGSKL